MAKKEKKEKGFMESVHDGYIRGSMGGEEDTSQARTVTSPEPLPDEIKKFRKLYILVPISLIIGILKGDFTGWLAIAAFILLCLVCLIDTYADHKVRRLRRMKFRSHLMNSLKKCSQFLFQSMAGMSSGEIMGN